MTHTPYATSPLFDERTLPEALRNDHRTKDGTWGLLRVLTGQVRLTFGDPLQAVIVSPDAPAVIPPQATHYVEPIGPMTMQVEFYRAKPEFGDA